MSNELTISGITISSGVIATIVTMAAEKVEGVAYVDGHNVATSIRSLLTSKPTVTEKAVSAEVVDDKLDITVSLAVFFGYPFTKLAEDVRTAVAEAVDAQVGVQVGAVNVCIDELVFPKE
jgi:uncharacterized alkaline shock family protein YloU